MSGNRERESERESEAAGTRRVDTILCKIIIDNIIISFIWADVQRSLINTCELIFFGNSLRIVVDSNVNNDRAAVN